MTTEKIEKPKPSPIEFEPGELGFKFCDGVITNISPQGQAFDKNVCIGWKIIEINNNCVSDSDNEIYKALYTNKEKKKNTI